MKNKKLKNNLKFRTRRIGSVVVVVLMLLVGMSGVFANTIVLNDTGISDDSGVILNLVNYSSSFTNLSVDNVSAGNVTVSGDFIGGNVANWDTAYGWGNHSSIGYILSNGDPFFNASDAFHVTSGLMTNWNTSYGWGDHSVESYLKSYGDPWFNASDAFHVTSGLMTNWNTSYGWGDHSGQNYFDTDTNTIDDAGNGTWGVIASLTNRTWWETAYAERGSQIAGTNLSWSGGQLHASLTSAVDGYFNITKIWNSNENNWTANANNLQTAIYDTNGSGDKWVVFPSMDLDQDIQTTDGLTLMGYSKSSTLTGTGSKRTIYVDGVSNVTLKDFTTKDYVQIRPYVNPSEIQRNICIENVDGYNISDIFIFVTCDGGTLDTLKIRNCKVNGTGVHGFHHDSPNDGGIRNLVVSDCVFSYCGANVSITGGDWAVGFNLCENGSVDGAVISNCIFEYCWESGFHTERNAVTKDVVVTNCISRNNGMKNDYSGGYDHGTYGYGAFFGAGFKVSSNISFVNCKASDNRYGFHASCMNGTGYRFVHNVSISSCEIKNCDNGTGIYLPYIVNLIVDSCRIHNVTNTSYYGISLYDAKKSKVRDCDIFDVLRCIDVNLADNITISDNGLSDTDGSRIYNIPSYLDINIFDNIGYEHDYTTHHQHYRNASSSIGLDVYLNATGCLVWDFYNV